MNQTIRLVIVDDHHIVVDGLKSLFEKEPGFEVVAEGFNGADALSIARLYGFDVMLMDLNLPDKSGLETSKEILTLYPEARILALTMNDSHSMIKNCVDAGMKGYVLKNTLKADLLDAVQRVYKGEIVLPEGLHLESLEETGDEDSRSPLERLLTKREKEVLGYILQQKTTQEIAEILGLSTHTAETHRKNILHKLGVKNTAGLVKLAVSSGFME